MVPVHALQATMCWLGVKTCSHQQQHNMLCLVLVIVCHICEKHIMVHACNPCWYHSIVCEESWLWSVVSLLEPCGYHACRQHVEAAMEESSADERLQREAAAERRKQARTDIKRLQEQEIALLIARYPFMCFLLHLASWLSWSAAALSPAQEQSLQIWSLTVSTASFCFYTAGRSELHLYYLRTVSIRRPTTGVNATGVYATECFYEQLNDQTSIQTNKHANE